MSLLLAIIAGTICDGAATMSESIHSTASSCLRALHASQPALPQNKTGNTSGTLLLPSKHSFDVCCRTTQLAEGQLSRHMNGENR